MLCEITSTHALIGGGKVLSVNARGEM